MNESPAPRVRLGALALTLYGLCSLALAIGWQWNLPWSLHWRFLHLQDDVGWGTTICFAVLGGIGLFGAQRRWSGRMDRTEALVALAWLVLLSLSTYFAAPWLWVMFRNE